MKSNNDSCPQPLTNLEEETQLELNVNALSRMADFRYLGHALASALGTTSVDFDFVWRCTQVRQEQRALENPIAATFGFGQLYRSTLAKLQCARRRVRPEQVAHLRFVTSIDLAEARNEHQAGKAVLERREM